MNWSAVASHVDGVGHQGAHSPRSGALASLLASAYQLRSRPGLFRARRNARRSNVVGFGPRLQLLQNSEGARLRHQDRAHNPALAAVEPGFDDVSEEGHAARHWSNERLARRQLETKSGLEIPGELGFLSFRNLLTFRPFGSANEYDEVTAGLGCGSTLRGCTCRMAEWL